MRPLLGGLSVVTLALLCAVSPARGQKATEQYIPIGQSPGVSGKYTWIGEIADLNLRARTVTITDAAGPRTIRITEKTRIWLDRSKLKLTNLTGHFSDLRKGGRIEMKYETPERRDVVEWVKVEVTP
jgi:hypothetical protein